MKQKVLFILPTLHAAGAENYLLRFLKYCSDHTELEAAVLSVNEEKGELHDEFLQLGVSIVYQSLGYINPFKIWQLYRFIKKEKFQTVCTFTGNFGGIPMFLSAMAGVKNRIAWHRRSTDAFKASPLKNLYNTSVAFLLKKYASSILSNSEDALRYFYGEQWKKDKRKKIIPNGVTAQQVITPLTKSEARKLLGIKEQAIWIGHIGRFTTEKNHLSIFKAIKELTLKNEDIRAVFCGRGTDTEAFSQMQK